MILNLPPELHVQTLTFLRAQDLSALQQTCRVFNNRQMIQTIIDNFATDIYPPELTDGFDTPVIGGEVDILRDENQMFKTYEALRNMEMLVVARVLSRPEPTLSPEKTRNGGYYYVSKSWCRTALKWLDFQTETRRKREEKHLEDAKEAAKVAAGVATISPKGGKKGKQGHGHGKKQKKRSKREERKRNKVIQTNPPPPNVNSDITCSHGRLMYCGSSSSNGGGGNINNNICHVVGGRSYRAKRRLMDKQAWKVLKKLYPQGAQLSSLDGECIQCAMEAQTERRNQEMKKMRETEERKKPLQDPLVRAFYSRRTGVPKASLVFQNGTSAQDGHDADKLYPLLTNGSICPLKPGVYSILPRSWCHRWRKFIKTGDSRPTGPDASSLLCDGHRLPLIPPHLENFLYGETNSLLDVILPAFRTRSSSIGSNDGSASTLPVGFSPIGQRLGGNGPRTPAAAAAVAASASASGRPRTPRTPRTPLQDDDLAATLRSSGLSESEIQLQRLAMIQIEEERTRQMEAEEQRRRQAAAMRAAQAASAAAASSTPTATGSGGGDTPMSPEEIRVRVNEQLDRENRVVVEILTDAEFTALEKWWPNHSSYALKFAVVESDYGTTDIVWTTAPCVCCDASARADEHYNVRNRNRSWVNNVPKKRFK